LRVDWKTFAGSKRAFTRRRRVNVSAEMGGPGPVGRLVGAMSLLYVPPPEGSTTYVVEHRLFWIGADIAQR
jgi:hypothetical protein